MTTTIEGGFGSHNWAAGFLLNNELTDFSFRPVDAEGRPIANAVGPGKRPRSSMAPTIVFDKSGKVLAVLGSPGGSQIILYVVKALVAMLDWDKHAQEAADLTELRQPGRRLRDRDRRSGRVDRAAAQGFRPSHRAVPDELRPPYRGAARRTPRRRSRHAPRRRRARRLSEIEARP